MSSESKSSVIDLGQRLESLRKSYIRAYPKQRLHVAMQRIKNPDHDPNRLIAYVAAVEGLARSLCMYQHPKARTRVDELYPSYVRRGAETLVGEYLASKNLGKPRALFGDETWELFEYAVQYRNLLAHECTYLGGDLSPKLIEACRVVLRTLAEHAGLDTDDI